MYKYTISNLDKNNQDIEANVNLYIKKEDNLKDLDIQISNSKLKILQQYLTYVDDNWLDTDKIETYSGGGSPTFTGYQQSYKWDIVFDKFDEKLLPYLDIFCVYKTINTDNLEDIFGDYDHDSNNQGFAYIIEVKDNNLSQPNDTVKQVIIHCKFTADNVTPGELLYLDRPLQVKLFIYLPNPTLYI